LELEIISEKDNPILKRKEALVGIKGTDATPSRKEVVASVASHFNVSESLILVDQILTEFGISTCRAKVKIYQDAKDIPKQRLAIVKARSKSTAEKKAEEVQEKPPEEKKEPAKEEKKEEKPAEEKKEAKPEKPKEEKPAEKKEEKKAEKKEEPKKEKTEEKQPQEKKE